jgi:hypothetical protein
MLRHRSRKAALGISVMSLFLVRPPAPAAGHAQHSQQLMTLPVAVNGAESPQLISDELAYRHFILSVAVPQNASDEHLSRQDRKLQRAGLSSTDRSAAIRALRGLAEELEANAGEVNRLSGQVAVPSEQLDALRARRLALLDVARSQVALGLSASGHSKLDAYIREHVKRRIVIYGEAPNESAVPLAVVTR